MPRHRRSPGNRPLKEIWVVACEDSKSAPAYLKELFDCHFSDKHHLRLVHRDANQTSPRQIVERAMSEAGTLDDSAGAQTRVFAVIDVEPQAAASRQQVIDELCGDHRKCKLILSSPCFEHWLRLHLNDCDGGHDTAQGAVKALKAEWIASGLSGSYSKGRAPFRQLLTGERLEQATCRARQQHWQKSQGDHTRAHRCPPCVTEMYKLIEALQGAAKTAP